MADRPILFSGPMIRALMGGYKTQTRRVLTPQPDNTSDPSGDGRWGRCNRYGYWRQAADAHVYSPGDRLWVRERHSFPQSWIDHPDKVHIGHVFYAADADAPVPSPWLRARPDDHTRLRSSIHMPRSISRLTLTVTDVRVERLQEISRGDAMAEGCPFANMKDGPDPRDWYASLWNTLHGAGAWDANPWVVAVTFTVACRNIDDDDMEFDDEEATNG